MDAELQEDEAPPLDPLMFEEDKEDPFILTAEAVQTVSPSLCCFGHRGVERR